MTRTKRTLKPAGYVALAVLGLLVIGLAMTAWSWVDTQFIHPYGYGIPTHLAATFTPTPQVVATQQPAATSELDALPPLVTATPPGTSPRAAPSLSPTATDARAASLPWAGKPVPDEIVKSITANWIEMYKTLYDYQGIKANGKPATRRGGSSRTGGSLPARRWTLSCRPLKVGSNLARRTAPVSLRKAFTF